MVIRVCKFGKFIYKKLQVWCKFGKFRVSLV